MPHTPPSTTTDAPARAQAPVAGAEWHVPVHSPEGCHILLELSGCRREHLMDGELLSSILVESARTAGATVVETVFHAFAPQGVSGVVVIAESHITVHTWPEHGYAAIDIFTCGEPQIARRIQDEVVAALTPRHFSTREFCRRPHPHDPGSSAV